MTDESSRFASTSAAEIENHIQLTVPPNTKSKEKWAIRLFHEWHSRWIANIDDGILKVFKSLDEMDKSDLNYCLKFFIADVRKVNGSKYPPKTLKVLFAMVQHHFNYELKKPWSLFIDKEFLDARRVLDAEMRLSAKEGNVKQVKRPEIITSQDEKELWDRNFLGDDNPKKLQHTFIFMSGLICGLRAASEHYDLRYGEQFFVDGENLI